MSPEDAGVAAANFTGTAKKPSFENDVPSLFKKPERTKRNLIKAPSKKPAAAEAAAPVMGVSNCGPALRKYLSQHGQEKYDPGLREELVAAYNSVGESAGRILKNVMNGCRQVDFTQINQSALIFVDNLKADFDCSLNVVFEATQDEDLTKHAMSTAIVAMAIAIELGLDLENVRQIGVISLVQDWGMAQVPIDIRNLDRPLTQLEQLEIRKHPHYTAELLTQIPSLPSYIHTVAYQIHERPDGSGYPRGLHDQNIHLFAKIIHVADEYVAMISRRPHRQPIMPYSVMECLLREAERQRVDSQVVRALLHVLSLFPVGSFVRLSDESTAQVVRSNGENFASPVISRVEDKDGNPIDPAIWDTIVDLSMSDLRVAEALPTPGREEIVFNHEILTRHT